MANISLKYLYLPESNQYTCHSNSSVLEWPCYYY